jgi:hypothetical protein
LFKLTPSEARLTLVYDLIADRQTYKQEGDADAVIKKLVDNKFIICNNEAAVYSKDAGRQESRPPKEIRLEWQAD